MAEDRRNQYPYERRKGRHIEKRRNGYYAVLEIPPELRKHFRSKNGKPLARFIQSLKTDSPKKAERLAAPLIATWRQEIARARGEPADDDAAFWRHTLAKTPPERRAAILAAIEIAAWDIGAATVENVGERPSASPEAKDFYAQATGQTVTLKEHLDAWLANSRASKKTQDMQRSDVERFAEHFPLVRDVERSKVQKWIERLMQNEGLTPKTVQRILSALRGYWRYLQAHAVAPADATPFHGLDVASNGKRRDPKTERRPFEAPDVVRLWHEAKRKGDQELADVIEMAMWSGARIEELCSLGCAKVNLREWWFEVEDAKTPAGWRQVPIHKKARALFRRLIGKRPDGFVFAKLTANKYGDRSNAVGKRFGHLKEAMGFGPQFVFHSIRRTVATQFEQANIGENVAADVLGHEKGATMSYGLYSGGTSLAQKRAAIERLSYPGV